MIRNILELVRTNKKGGERMQKNFFNRRKRTFYANDLEYEAAMYVRDWLQKLEKCNFIIESGKKNLEIINKHMQYIKYCIFNEQERINEIEQCENQCAEIKKELKKYSAERATLLNESITLEELFLEADYDQSGIGSFRRMKYGQRKY